MEKDGKTRLYLCGGSVTSSAWLVYPPEERTEYCDRLKGENADEILQRADLKCVSTQVNLRDSHGGLGALIEDLWGCYIPGEARFIVDRMGVPHEKRYPLLAAKIEEHTRRTGLTVLVY